jgi:hypothetical protein
MKTDCTPESDVGASARLTLSVELELLLSPPPPQAGSSVQDTRADASTGRKTACFIAIELFTPLPPAGANNLPMPALLRRRTTEQGLNMGSNASGEVAPVASQADYDQPWLT